MSGYCLDTGPLFDFLLLRYTSLDIRSIEETALPLELEPLLRGLTSRFARRAFVDLLRRGRPIMTVEGVLAEISHHVESSRRLNNIVFWRTAKATYLEWAIVEEPASVRVLDVRGLCDFGAVDEALLQVCARTKATLVSTDRALRQRANVVGVRLITADELIAEFAA